MSYVMAVPEMLAAAATDVAAVGSTVNAAHMAATPSTVAVIPAAADEVSASIAQVFSRCAQDYHALAGQAAAFNRQFVQHLNAAANSYAATEVSSVSSLQPVNASAASNIPITTTLMNYLESYLKVLQAVGNTLATTLEIIAYNIAFVAWLILDDIIRALDIIVSKIFGVMISLSLPPLPPLPPLPSL